MKEITKCEVCDNETLIPVLNLGKHPMCDDLIKVGDERQNEEYPIEILFCDKCKTAHQKYQIPKKELFPSDYHYRAKFTKDVLDGMKKLVDDLETNFGKLSGKTVLDIGCNDGSLLDFFKAKGCITLGVEPTDACIEAIEKGHSIRNAYFSPELVKGELYNEKGTIQTTPLLKYPTIAPLPKPDIITFTNVFAHIEDLNNVLEGLKLLMKPETLLVIENHYLGAVFAKNQFDTFYHEHPRTYSLNSFIHIASNLGLDLLNVEFPSRYGGNIRVIIGDSYFNKQPIQTINIADVIVKEEEFKQQFEKMNEMIEVWEYNKLHEIKTAVQKYGALEAKAFPGRAAIPIKMLGLDETDIRCVYEKPGSLKIGMKIPSTSIPILSDENMDLNKTKCILNLAWHISSEIEYYLREKGYKGEIINII